MYAVNTLHVAHDLAFTLDEMRRALEPGGQLIVSECVRPRAADTLYPEFVFNLLETFRSPHLHPAYRPNGGFLTPEQWTDALEAAGFRDVRLLPDITRIRDEFSGILRRGHRRDPSDWRRMTLMPTPTPPHPVLDRYYRHEGRSGLVRHRALRRRGPGTTTGSVTLLAFGSGPFYRRQALRARRAASRHEAARRRHRYRPGGASGRAYPRRSAPASSGSTRAPACCGRRGGRTRVRSCRGGPSTMPLRGRALRHAEHGLRAAPRRPTLEIAFTEYRRVLKPGGRLLMLEVSRPPSAVTRWAIRVYFQRVLPLIIRIGTRSPRRARCSWQYYWDTIDECVPPADDPGGAASSRLRRRPAPSCWPAASASTWP